MNVAKLREIRYYFKILNIVEWLYIFSELSALKRAQFSVVLLEALSKQIQLCS